MKPLQTSEISLKVQCPCSGPSFICDVTLVKREEVSPLSDCAGWELRLTEAKLVVIYSHPKGPEALEKTCASGHLPLVVDKPAARPN